MELEHSSAYHKKIEQELMVVVSFTALSKDSKYMKLEPFVLHYWVKRILELTAYILFLLSATTKLFVEIDYSQQNSVEHLGLYLLAPVEGHLIR